MSVVEKQEQKKQAADDNLQLKTQEMGFTSAASTPNHGQGLADTHYNAAPGGLVHKVRRYRRKAAQAHKGDQGQWVHCLRAAHPEPPAFECDI